MGGEGGYIRIQNKSSQAVNIKLIQGRNVDDVGLDKIVGKLAPNEQLPKQGKKIFQGTYQYIEGDVNNRFQKDGSFELQAVPTDGTPVSKLTLVVDHNSWECKDTSPDKASSVKLVADVHEVNGEWKMELRVFDNYNPCKWMEEYGEKYGLGDKPFCRIGLPGTHDSGTYKFNKELGASPDSGLTAIEDILDKGKVLGKLNDWILTQIFDRLCQCQAFSIQEQLEQGIRYVDLRVAYHKDSDSFMTCHGVYCVNVKEILQEIKAFLDENTKEIVIVEFKKLFEFQQEQHEALSNLIIETLGDKLANHKKCPCDATVQQYWDKGYQVVVLYQDRNTADQSGGKIWPLFLLDSPWPNAGNTDELYTALKEKVENHNKKQFFVAQGILTPDVDLIKKEIMDGDGMSIRKISRRAGGKVVDWVEEEWKPTQNLNIVIVDFFEDCNLLPAVINYNRK